MSNSVPWEPTRWISAWKPAKRSEVAQRSTRDDGNFGLGQVGQTAEGDGGFPQRKRLHWVVDDGRDRPVVVAGDEELGCGCELVEAGDQFRVVEHVGHGR